MDLSQKQKMHLRALAHHLDAVVLVGNGGVSEAVLQKIGVELDNHELIKVKVGKEAPIGVKESAPGMAEALKASIIQVIGRTVVLYKRRRDKPTIQLPKI